MPAVAAETTRSLQSSPSFIQPQRATPTYCTFDCRDDRPGECLFTACGTRTIKLLTTPLRLPYPCNGLYFTKERSGFVHVCTVGVYILLGFPHTITDASLHPFHDFLVSKAPSSFLALRNLGFTFRKLNAQDARMGPADTEVFLGILRKAARLETLRLSNKTLSRMCQVPISSLPALRLSTIAPAFPNLQSLIVAGTTTFFSDPAIFPSSISRFRQENIQFQRQHSSPIWRLSHLSADFECLAALGLQFHEPHLTITRFPRCNAEELMQLQDALSVLQPMHLVIRHSGSTSMGSDPYSLPQLFCLGLEALRSFDMSIRVSSCHLMYGHGWIMDKLRDGLGLIADLVQPGLLVLSLRVETNHGQLAERYMDKLDKDTLIRQIANKLPTLQVLNFQSRGVRGRRQQHWLRRNPNGGMLEVPPERHDLVKRMEDQLYSTFVPV